MFRRSRLAWGVSRREVLRVLAAAAGLPDLTRGRPFADDSTQTARPMRMQTRAIPATGEALPVVGVGTWLNFDVAPGSTEYRSLPGVLQALFAAGGSVIDSSPMYRRAEQTTGELLSAIAPPPPAFLATKVWTSGRDAGIAQMEQSFTLLRATRIDLMQVHNLQDWRTHLPTLRRWKGEGRLRYVGISHYTASAYVEVEAVLKAEPLDFLQINYALDDRAAERRLLPLARDRGVAVIVNMPFGGGSLLRRLRDRPLPAWAAEAGSVSWAQLALRFVLAHPAVTCVIPGTGNPRYMAENAAAGAAPPLTERQRQDLVAATG
jgi:diketogulonate reductase-like aldo/keto reductase